MPIYDEVWDEEGNTKIKLMNRFHVQVDDQPKNSTKKSY